MVLCIGIVEDGLSRNVLCKSYIHTNNPFVLERAEVYQRGTVFSTGVLYIAQSSTLPESFTAQDGAALICTGMPPDAYLKSAIQVLALDASTDLLDLLNDVNRIFFEYNTLEQNLQDSVNKGRSIQNMVEQMAPYFNGNELLVCNDEFRIVGQSNETIHLHELSGLGQPDKNGIIPPEIVTYFKNDVVFANVRNVKEPFVYESRIFSCRAIDMNVFYQGEYACRVIIAEDVNTFRGYEAGLLKFFTRFVQLVYDHVGASRDILPRDHITELFIDLLNGDSIELHRLKNSFVLRGWQDPGPFICASILPSNRDYYNRTIAYYCQIFSRDIEGCCFFEYNNVIVCVADLEYYNGSLDRFITTNIETFRDGNFRIGYSNVFNDVTTVRHHYLQSKIALEIGIAEYPSIWHHKFPEIALSYIQSKITADLPGRYVCAPEVLLLNAYDKANQTDLLHTLRQYLNNQMNAIKTASELFIHRSTMVYRLERIKELTGIDLKDSAKTLYLSISINLLFNE